MRKITNNSTLLFLGVDPENLDTVVCLTKVSNDLTIDELDATTTCGIAKMAGEMSGSISCDGQHLLDHGTGKVSGHSLFVWAKAKQVLYYEIGPAIPESGDVLRTGQCFITSLGNNYSYNAQSTFSCTLSIVGEPDEVISEGEIGIFDDTFDLSFN